MTVRVIVGDALAVLRTLESESVQCVVTSPPYFNLRDYKCDGQLGLEPTPAAFIAALVEVFEEVKRVLRKDGLVFCNLGDSYSGSGKGGQTGTGSILQKPLERQGFVDAHCYRGIPAKNLLLIPERFSIAMQDAGWIVRSRIAWCKKAPMPESTKDRPTSAWEHIYMFSKSRTYFYDAEAVRQPNSGAPRDAGRPRKGMPWLAAIAAQDLWQSGTPTHGGLAGAQPAGASLRNFWLLGPEPSSLSHYASFPTAIPRRCILAGTSQAGACPSCGSPLVRVVERTKGREVDGPKASAMLEAGVRTAGYNGTRGSTLGIGGHAGAGWREQGSTSVTAGWSPSCACIDAGPPVPQTVLDPFGGSGTVGLVADRLGREAILIDLSPDYCAMAKARIESDAGLLFDEPVTVEASRQINLFDALEVVG